jgi:hypothetical protein
MLMEDQHEENVVKLVSLIKRQMGFDKWIDRYGMIYSKLICLVQPRS